MIPLELHDPDCACYLCELEREQAEAVFFDDDRDERADDEQETS